MNLLSLSLSSLPFAPRVDEVTIGELDCVSPLSIEIVVKTTSTLVHPWPAEFGVSSFGVACPVGFDRGQGRLAESIKFQCARFVGNQNNDWKTVMVQGSFQALSPAGQRKGSMDDWGGRDEAE